MNVDLDKLETLAKVATRGPWERLGAYQVRTLNRYEGHSDIVVDETDQPDAAFIAAANPVTVLALIAELRTLRAWRDTVWTEPASALPVEDDAVIAAVTARHFDGHWHEAKTGTPLADEMIDYWAPIPDEQEPSND